MAILAGVLPIDVIRRMFLPVLVTLQQDPVPNIRMNVAKTINQIIPALKGAPDVEDKMRQIVRDLANNDQDNDVKYFAQRAIQTIQGGHA